jgi:hypothetical protein
VAASGLLATSSVLAAGASPSPTPLWDPGSPLKTIGAKLRVQPVLMSVVQEHKDETSYRNWGSVHTEPAAVQEAERFRAELRELSAEADFPLELLPLARVGTVDEARQVQQGDHDTILLFPASGSQELLMACFAAQPNRDTLLFVRHRSGPLYYWYEALSTIMAERRRADRAV